MSCLTRCLVNIFKSSREKRKFDKAYNRITAMIDTQAAKIDAIDEKIKDMQQRVESAAARVANNRDNKAYRKEGLKLQAELSSLVASRAQFVNMKLRGETMRGHLESMQMAQEVTKQNNMLSDISSRSALKPDEVIKSYDDMQGHLDDMEEIKDVHAQFVMNGEADIAEMDFDALVDSMSRGQVEFSAEAELAALRAPPTRPISMSAKTEETDTDTTRLIEFDTS